MTSDLITEKFEFSKFKVWVFALFLVSRSQFTMSTDIA